jgi:putative ABC transport system ATP-binding protein
LNISINHLKFRYSGGAGEFVMDIPSLDIRAGEKIAIIGPSGSGKSTLLQLLAGILVPAEGSISIGDTEVSSLADARRRAFRITSVGFVFQDFELIDYLNVIENILLPFRLHPGLSLTSDDRSRAGALAGKLGLAGKEKRGVRNLSQGERQRVAIGRALIHKPGIVLADEPTGNLDPANKYLMVDLLRNVTADSGATLIMVTHDHALLDGWDRIVDFKDLLAAANP